MNIRNIKRKLSRIGKFEIAVSLVVLVVVAVVWNVVSSPTEYKGSKPGHVVRMWMDETYHPPTYDKDGNIDRAGYWTEDYYIMIGFDSGDRSTYTISERRWKRDFVVGDSVKVEYYQRGIFPFHEIKRTTP